MHRFLLWIPTTLALSALPGAGLAAQQDSDWTSLPPPPPALPPPAPAPGTSARPPEPAAPKTAPATPVPAPTPDYKTTLAVPVGPAPAVAPAAKDAPATTTRESVLPGTEPHTPTTAFRSVSEDNLRITSGLGGPTGLLRVGSADVGRPGLVRLSLLGELFSSRNFPVLNARNTRTAGTLALDYTILEYLEAYFSYAVTANTNNRASPPLMQSQGDVALGLKGGRELNRGLWAGADLRLLALPGVGAQDLRRYAFGFSPRLLGTYDVRRAAPQVPLRVHLNLGVTLDNSDSLIAGQDLTAAEEFALGIQKYDRFQLGLGVESPLPWATPFLEWGLAYPLGATGLLGPDGNAVAAGSAMPHQLTLGAKVSALRDISFVVGADLGLSRRVAKGIPATQPYNLFLGLTYHLEPMAKGESRLVEKTTVVEKRVEVATAPPVYTGKVSGQVLDAETRAPVAGVLVAMAGSGLPPVASDSDSGRFDTYELPAGKIQLSFARQGYKPAVLEASVEAGQVAPLQALLVREVKFATVKSGLTSGKKGVAGKLSFAGPKTADLVVAADGGGSVELPKGRYSATVEADGYLSKVKELDVPETGEVHLYFDLAPLPKQTLVVVRKDRIEIKQQVHFATGKAVILRDSFQLLDQVIDAIVRSGIKKVRVEGHTDNRGGKETNLKLSVARAEAVARHLISNGLPPAQIESEGFGDTRPIAPNLTARGRELNRRVEFLILQR